MNRKGAGRQPQCRGARLGLAVFAAGVCAKLLYAALWGLAAAPVASVFAASNDTPQPPPTGEEPVLAFDIDAPPKTRNRLTPTLSYGAKLEVEFESERNFDLESGDPDDVSTLEPELEVAFSYDPIEHVQAFLNLELKREFAVEEEGRDRDRPIRLQIIQAYIAFKVLFGGVSVQLGRQRFKDAREWLYDEKMDAVRLFYRRSRFELEVSASRKLIVGKDLLNNESKELINNYFVLGRYALGEESEIATYVLIRDDRSDRPENLYFFGLRSIGELTSNVDYWIDAAHVRGTDDSNDIRGYGFDLGTTYRFERRFDPSLTLGFAFGSGDSDPDAGVDANFRQTGLQDNNDKFNGITRFKYYGEVFEPELSNMWIFTAGVGVRPTRRSSIDLIYHRYRQHRASRKLRDVAIDDKPKGRDRDLGNGLDLVLGIREFENLNVELVLGAFFPGDAFSDEADNAYFAGVEIRYSF